MASKKWREANPVHACYLDLKGNAKRRGKQFDLTLEQFKKWCIKFSYMKLKGRYKESYTIDRKDHTKGYTIGNIQIMKQIDNSRKGALERFYDHDTSKMIFKTYTNRR